MMIFLKKTKNSLMRKILKMVNGLVMNFILNHRKKDVGKLKMNRFMGPLDLIMAMLINIKYPLNTRNKRVFKMNLSVLFKNL